MIYYDFRGVLLQNKNKKKSSEVGLVYDLKYFEELSSATCPMISSNTIIFIGQLNPNSDTGTKPKRSVLLMPLFNTPTFSILSDWERPSVVNEFFFHPPNSEQELIVYQIQVKHKPYIEFAFYKLDGKYVDSIRLSVEGVEDYRKFECDVSPNGKYMFYKENA